MLLLLCYFSSRLSERATSIILFYFPSQQFYFCYFEGFVRFSYASQYHPSSPFIIRSSRQQPPHPIFSHLFHLIRVLVGPFVLTFLPSRTEVDLFSPLSAFHRRCLLFSLDRPSSATDVDTPLPLPFLLLQCCLP